MAVGQSVPASKRKNLWRQLLTIVVTAVALTLIIKAFVAQPYRIPSQSMENTLLTGDRVLVNKLVYHFRGIDRGDIIVFSGRDSWGNLEGQPDTPPSSNPVVRILDDALTDIGLYSDAPSASLSQVPAVAQNSRGLGERRQDPGGPRSGARRRLRRVRSRPIRVRLRADPRRPRPGR